MIHQFLKKQKKLAKGIYFSYLRSRGQQYNAHTFWDTAVYTQGISDRQTISSRASVISAQYHYRSVELQILKHICNRHAAVEGQTMLDIGSGSGHWIDFYKSLNAHQLIGIDVSQRSVAYLKNKFAHDSNTSFYHGKAADIIDQLDAPINIVNAIGVMFHIVDDSEWEETIRKVAALIPPNGIFVVGGHFGLLNGLNVQIDERHHINKRLRSKAVWKKTLRSAGFSTFRFYRNRAYLWVQDTLPENNVLIATK